MNSKSASIQNRLVESFSNSILNILKSHQIFSKRKIHNSDAIGLNRNKSKNYRAFLTTKN